MGDWQYGWQHYWRDWQEQPLHCEVSGDRNVCSRCGCYLLTVGLEWRMCVCGAGTCISCATQPCASCCTLMLQEARRDFGYMYGIQGVVREPSGHRVWAPFNSPSKQCLAQSHTPEQARERRSRKMQEHTAELRARREASRIVIRRQREDLLRPAKPRKQKSEVRSITANITSDGSLRARADGFTHWAILYCSTQ